MAFWAARRGTEKITVNLGYVDLGHVDLKVEEGFYSNRTDFIRTAKDLRCPRYKPDVSRTQSFH